MYEIDKFGNVFLFRIGDNGVKISCLHNDMYDGKLPDDIKLKSDIIKLRIDKNTYAGIQLRLGNPSKKFIRNTLLEYAPDLINIDCNYSKL